MDKIDQYLDQVCRRIGGPKSLRQHVRQELREHLLDAIAEHRAAGMTEEQALARALEEFGGPEEVRSELEATHGSRLMPLVIDKAMQWKEKTMRAKWLWATWANLAVVIVIVLEVLWITFGNVYLTPKLQRLTRDGVIDEEALGRSGVAWFLSFLRNLEDIGSKATYILLGTIVAWTLFEWRVKSENKSFIRLSVFGTVAVKLLLVAILMSGSLVIPFMLTAPAASRVARRYALEEISQIDTAVRAAEQAQQKKDWQAIQDQTSRASEAVDRLVNSAVAVGSLTSLYGHPTTAELRAALRAANECLLEAQKTAQDKDAEGLQAALRKFHDRFAPVAKAAKSPER
jgi:hypothetical protein